MHHQAVRAQDSWLVASPGTEQTWQMHATQGRMHCQASSLTPAGSPTVLVYRKQPLTSASLETRVIDGKQSQASAPMPTKTKVPPLASACMPVCTTRQGISLGWDCVREDCS